MAAKRMFNCAFSQSDEFLAVSLSARGLYFHLCVSADDDGFFNGAGCVIRYTGATRENFNELLNAGLLLDLGNDVFAVTHWYIHNTISKDKYHETLFLEQKKKVAIDENKRYFIQEI